MSNGNVSGFMNRISGGIAVNGDTSGFANTVVPTMTPLVSGFTSGVDNYGSFTPGLFSVLPTLLKLLG